MNELKLKDTPNERVLNLFQGLEVILDNYLRTNPEDKEEAQTYLGYVRKALAGKFDELPEPEAKPTIETQPAQSEPLTQQKQLNTLDWAGWQQATLQQPIQSAQQQVQSTEDQQQYIQNALDWGQFWRR
jgi:Holliday junction resolvasome RuvABC DNA-binding subunit